MKHAELLRYQRETLLTVGALVLPKSIRPGWQTVGGLKGVELTASNFENAQPQLVMRRIACKSKLQLCLAS